MEDYDWREDVHSLRDDVTSGSQAMCLKAAEIIIKTLDNLPETLTGNDIVDRIMGLCREFKRAKPAMAGLYNLTAEVAQELETAVGLGKDAGEPARRVALGFRSRLLSSNSAIAANTLGLLPPNACVATISRSGVVEAVLKLAKEEGGIRRVLISEGRPAYEGRILSAGLDNADIPVVFVADGALPGILGQCDTVVVGGDALCPSGLVNKAGTYALGVAAQSLGRPFVACLGTEKMIPFDIPEHYLREDPSDLWADSPAGVQVVNRIFEFTPLELIDHIVTEEGVVSGENIPEIFASMKIHPHLQDWL